MFTALKRPIKDIRWAMRRRRAAASSGPNRLADMPILLGNSMPKSGSHLLIQVLLGFTRLGPFVDPGMPPLTRSEANKNLPGQKVLDNLQRLQPGDITYAYLHAREPYLSQLANAAMAPFFIYRDPRDVVVSHVFYATDLYEGHGMHDYYTQELESVEQRIDAAILGVEATGYELSAIADKYANYLAWLDQPNVHALRFEDLILDRRAALDSVLQHVESHGFLLQNSREQAIDILEAGIAPHQSGTFRKGQPGEWRQHFTTQNKKNFKQATGGLLQRLGYESGSDW